MQPLCANSGSYSDCAYEYDCDRPFLPSDNSIERKSVAELTKDSIEHLNCFDLPELYIAVERLRQNEPGKFVQDVCLFTGLVMLLFGSIILVIAKCCSKKNTNRKFWLKVQQIPHMDKIGKAQEVPYIKIDEPNVKA